MWLRFENQLQPLLDKAGLTPRDKHMLTFTPQGNLESTWLLLQRGEN